MTRSSKYYGVLLGVILLSACGVAVDEADPAAPIEDGPMSLPRFEPTGAKRCDEAPPAGSKLPAALPRYSGGTCPAIMAGKNKIKSTGHDREFLLAVPKDLAPGERLPVVFLWHWLGGSADRFYTRGEIQQAVDTQRFLAILPEAKSDMIFKWPFDLGVSSARMEEEFRFFDDMLACAAARYSVNTNCVSSAGVSAGALFTDQLAAARSQYLSSAISLSGGVGGEDGGTVKPWGTPSHKLPMLVLWGGLFDICIVINFNTASRALESALARQGHFILECTHNCGHGEPPFETPAGMSKYAGLWQFVFDHPFWLAPGASPYKTIGLPTSLPSWCAVGAGKSKTRTGMCEKPSC